MRHGSRRPARPRPDGAARSRTRVPLWPPIVALALLLGTIGAGQAGLLDRTDTIRQAAAVTGNGVSLAGTVAGSTVVGSALQLSAVVTSDTARTAVVDLEVYDSAGRRSLQKYWEGEALTAGQARTLTTTWTPTTAGTYTIKLGVFSSAWASLLVWHDAAATMTVTAAATPTATATRTASPSATTSPSAAASTSAAASPTASASSTSAASVTASPSAAASATTTASAAATATGRQVERLDRGLVSVRSGNGNLVSWRLLGTDPAGLAFNLYRDGTRLTSTPLTAVTSYLDTGASASAVYTVRTVLNGVERPATSAERPSLRLGSGYLDVPLSKPAGGTTPAGEAYTYSAGDASVGDLDGDGDLDLVLKWDPSNAHDNSQAGYTGNVYLDGLTLEGTRLWRIDLGRNIRAGAHYTQFQVYDYDGDGAAEVALKTADGTRDGAGTVIGDSKADYRNSSGYVLSGPEFLSVFSGRTGKVLQTVNYVPARGTVSSWGDSYGNRVDRFLAATAYLDGSHPSMIFSRGYYTRTVIAAWDFVGGKLTQRWVFDSNKAGAQYAGQGNHAMAIADVDADGKDEIVFGAMTIDDNGTPLWNTGLGHGDAEHVGDLDPSRAGLEVFKVTETATKLSSWMADAKTGKILWSTPAAGDNGRGVSADIWAGSAGAESWSALDAGGARNPKGVVVGRKPSSQNFLIWWDGDPVRELLDRTKIDKYGPTQETRLLTGAGVTSINGTKAVPAISGDLFGDWREEVVWPTTDSSALRIYSTPIPTDRRLVTLLHDTMYRTALAWQNTGYNQPPHPSYFIGAGMATPPRESVRTPN